MFIRFFVFILLSLSQLQAGFPEWLRESVHILPDNGTAPITRAIKNSQHSIDLCLYHLDDEKIIDLLIDAKKRGVNVRVILNKPSLYQQPFSVLINQETSDKLKKNDISVSFLEDHLYTFTHYKFIIFDDSYGMIQTFNYDDFNFKQARNFGIFIKNDNQISVLKKIFDNDFKGKSAENDSLVKEFYNTADIVLGPVGQRQFMYDFLNSAQKSIYIYQQDLCDPEIGNILCQLRREGIKVNILMSPAPFGGIDTNRLNQTKIQALGGEYRFHPKKELYIHAKVILIDPEIRDRVYVGSCNLWPESLTNNRELGIIIHDSSQVKTIFNTFKKDWKNRLTYDEALVDKTAQNPTLYKDVAKQ